MRVLITGAAGMVGRALAEHCRGLGDEVFALDRGGLDVTDERGTREAFSRLSPDAVINCAAWTDVDGCELDPQRAFLVNSQGVEVMATAARLAGASFVQISTDYVFDGRRAEGFYTQRDDPHPLSAYGAAKLEGERRAQEEFSVEGRRHRARRRDAEGHRRLARHADLRPRPRRAAAGDSGAGFA